MQEKLGEKALKETKKTFCRILSYENSLQISIYKVKCKYKIYFLIMIFKKILFQEILYL